MIELKQPKEIEIEGKTFIISKIPCIPGREIISQYITTMIPKTGDYARNEEICLQILSYVEIKTVSGNKIRLSTKELVNNHITGDYPYEILLKLEAAMIGYNSSFFQPGRISSFLSNIAPTLPLTTIKTLTDLLEPFFHPDVPRSMNLKQSTQ
jgi:hypothetical protein